MPTLNHAEWTLPLNGMNQVFMWAVTSSSLPYNPIDNMDADNLSITLKGSGAILLAMVATLKNLMLDHMVLAKQ